MNLVPKEIISNNHISQLNQEDLKSLKDLKRKTIRKLRISLRKIPCLYRNQNQLGMKDRDIIKLPLKRKKSKMRQNQNSTLRTEVVQIQRRAKFIQRLHLISNLLLSTKTQFLPHSMQSCLINKRQKMEVIAFLRKLMTKTNTRMMNLKN